MWAIGQCEVLWQSCLHMIAPEIQQRGRSFSLHAIAARPCSSPLFHSLILFFPPSAPTKLPRMLSRPTSTSLPTSLCQPYCAHANIKRQRWQTQPVSIEACGTKFFLFIPCRHSLDTQGACSAKGVFPAHPHSGQAPSLCSGQARKCQALYPLYTHVLSFHIALPSAIIY